ncbi:hypothetical protein [Actinomyces bouchesdurhonensis]|uniref:hypothetical protein n=1 Tax=Actinomyces bouchesdurhonensis TaxID=1852361 RepID=UPI0023F3A29E|nr:hypothetical protein [Actinomyces bouchesdurhonensis]
MSTIEQNLIGNTAGLSRADKVLRWVCLLPLIGLTAYSIGGSFFGRGVPLRNDGLAMMLAVLACLTPGYSRTIPGVHRFLRACEWAVMGCPLVCTAAVIVGDVTDHGVRPDPYNTPWNVAMGAGLVALCFFVVLLIAKERARRRGLVPPAR